MKNHMTQAFEQAAFARTVDNTRTMNVWKMCDKQPDVKHGWNAHLSYKTAQQLKAQGILL